MDALILHLESACRNLGILATLFGAPKVFHTYCTIIGILSTKCEFCYCKLVSINDMNVFVYLITALCSVLDLIGL